MPERRKRLTDKLSEFDDHLGAGDPLDAELEEPLQEAIGSVRQALEASGDSEDHEDLTDALSDLALKLEVSHPKLTELLNHISEILAGAGI